MAARRPSPHTYLLFVLWTVLPTLNAFPAVELANGSQSAIRWTKYSLNNWLRQAGPIFDASTALEMLGFMSEDVKEGVLSHREKRAPNFRKDCPL